MAALPRDIRQVTTEPEARALALKWEVEGYARVSPRPEKSLRPGQYFISNGPGTGSQILSGSQSWVLIRIRK